MKKLPASLSHCLSDGLAEGVREALRAPNTALKATPQEPASWERGFAKCSVKTLFIQMTGRKQWRWVRVARQGLGRLALRPYVPCKPASIATQAVGVRVRDTSPPLLPAPN